MNNKTENGFNKDQKIILKDGSIVDQARIFDIPKNSTSPADVQKLFDTQILPVSAGHAVALTANPGPADKNTLVKIKVDPAISEKILQIVKTSGLFKAAQFDASIPVTSACYFCLEILLKSA